MLPCTLSIVPWLFLHTALIRALVRRYLRVHANVARMTTVTNASAIADALVKDIDSYKIPRCINMILDAEGYKIWGAARPSREAIAANSTLVLRVVEVSSNPSMATLQAALRQTIVSANLVPPGLSMVLLLVTKMRATRRTVAEEE
jgi:hypothetical protein